MLEDTLHPKTKNPQQEGSNFNKIKSNRWATHKLGNIMPKKFSRRNETAEPHTRLTRTGAQQ